MNYELWFSAAENSYELVSENDGQYMVAFRAPDSVCVAVLQAESWDQALLLKRRFLGLEDEGEEGRRR